ncbi:MAG TPA: ABC transporter permease [Firmicutes bacterium]|jgi:multiple sugar transport system permease protein|nr:ABC transporter permease [Bacillota bacterium]
MTQRKNQSSRAKKIRDEVGIYAALTILAIISMFPVLWMVLTSLKTRLQTFAIPPVWWFKPTFDNYRDVIFGTGGFDFPFKLYFWNSLIVGITSTVISMILATIAAYALVRFRLRYRNAIAMLILAVRMLPPIALVVPLFIIFKDFHLYDTIPALVLVYTALSIPLATWLMRGFFSDQGTMLELEESSMVDGTNRLGAFIKIILPLITPGLAATAIFSFILSWNDLLIALVLTASKAATLPIAASRVRVEEGIMWGQLGAIGTIVMIPVVIITMIAQKYLVRGLTAGAVKG